MRPPLWTAAPRAASRRWSVRRPRRPPCPARSTAMERPQPVAHIRDPRAGVRRQRRALPRLRDRPPPRRMAWSPRACGGRRRGQPLVEHQPLDQEHLIEVGLPVRRGLSSDFLNPDAGELLPGAQHVGLHLREVAYLPEPDTASRHGASISGLLPVFCRLPAAERTWMRMTREAERFPQLVDQETLVTKKVEAGGHVGEEHERGRRHAGLRRVENANAAAPGSGADGWRQSSPPAGSAGGS